MMSSFTVSAFHLPVGNACYSGHNFEKTSEEFHMQ